MESISAPGIAAASNAVFAAELMRLTQMSMSRTDDANYRTIRPIAAL
jgi:hypothetical protein